jgi:biotin transport system substrate-specific component
MSIPEAEKKKRRFDAWDLAIMAMGIALITVCSWISVPLTVPFTLQTFAVCLIAALFGPRRGLGAVGCYILLGAVGAPVFAGFKGGIGALLGVTGGYLVSYLFMGLVVIGAEKWFGRSNLVFLIAGVIALIVCYAFGTAWFVVAYARTAGPISWAAALGKCVVPFVLPDLAKLALAALLRSRVGKYLPQAA